MAVLAAAVPWALGALEQHQVETLEARLLADSRVVAAALPRGLAGEALDGACAVLAADLGARLTVIARDGRVLGESTRPSVSLDNHADRPEVRAALATGSGRAVRDSGTVGERLLYVASLDQRASEARVVRVALPLTRVDESLEHLRWRLLSGLTLAGLLGVAAAVGLSGRVRRRIERLIAFTGQVATGAPAPYLDSERDDALGLLEAHLGAMAGRIETTIEALRVEQERLEAILRGMVEGVLVTDLAGAVVLMNGRAREVLELRADVEGRGRPLVELSRDPALAEVARDLAQGAETVSRDVTLAAGTGRTLQVNGARLRGVTGEPFGVVLVLHDVTELRRLEVVRRDFVANVSHELRTPLTAIKGYAETLLGPVGDDRETARRFLAVIDRHSERLGRLIDDLLTLSNLELGRTRLRLGTVSVATAIDDVLQILAARGAQAGVDVVTQVAPGTPALHGDGDRIRQVLINLVDNAIKFTPAGGRVTIEAATAASPVHAGMVELVVADTGVGIPARDLPRLTERFFRVDKARSRELGGTGLGLAIVKHIVQLHGGTLAITSVQGQGTVVRVLLPAAAATQSVRGT
ncbi:MAG: ATP-binding protein [Candidatus Binatia bacterium]